MEQLYGGQNGYFMSTLFGIGMRQRLLSRYLLEAGYGYGKNKYNSQYAYYEGRKDPLQTARMSCRYLISDWLAAGLDFSRIKNSSNFSNEKYTVNRVSIMLDINPAFKF